MLRIGLTGGIGSGKSTVAEEFRRLGAAVIDTDAIAHELVQPGSEALAEIVGVFGRDVLNGHGALDRGRLRRIVFSDPNQRRRLEAILHPRIWAEVARRVTALAAVPYCVIVVPLLAESGSRHGLDRVLVVEAPEDRRIERLLRSRDLTREEIRLILAAQASRAQRLEIADDVIENTGTLEELHRQVAHFDRLYRQWANRVQE